MLVKRPFRSPYQHHLKKLLLVTTTPPSKHHRPAVVETISSALIKDTTFQETMAARDLLAYSHRPGVFSVKASIVSRSVIYLIKFASIAALSLLVNTISNVFSNYGRDVQRPIALSSRRRKSG